MNKWPHLLKTLGPFTDPLSSRLSFCNEINLYIKDHFCMLPGNERWRYNIRPANERRRCHVTPSLIGWAHTQKWVLVEAPGYLFYCVVIFMTIIIVTGATRFENCKQSCDFKFWNNECSQHVTSLSASNDSRLGAAGDYRDLVQAVVLCTENDCEHLLPR